MATDDLIERAEAMLVEAHPQWHFRSTLEELLAVVKRLPVTADGVPVVEARPLYWWDRDVLRVGAGGMEETMMFHDPDRRGVWLSPNCGIAGCYSTREAAEQARKAGG